MLRAWSEDANNNLTTIMFSKNTLTILLAIVLIVMSVQTYSLVSLSKKVAFAQVSLGQQTSVSLTGAPDMVGGC